MKTTLRRQAFPTLKRIKQITGDHCGPAVLASLFSFVGRRLSQTAVVRSLRLKKKIKSHGVNVKGLAKATSIFGKGEAVFWQKREAKINDLNVLVNKYHQPVGVEWQGVFYEDEDEDSGHYSIVTEIDTQKGFLKLADPYKKFVGKDRKFKIKDFVKRWWDRNEIRGRTLTDRKMMFIVTPKSASFPKKLGMLKLS